VEVVNEAEFYTLHPLAMQSDFAMPAGVGGYVSVIETCSLLAVTRFSSC
jgi:hypothetical protein